MEEEVILDYFKDHIGTFLDLGANDGETFSNTRALALKGWSGVLIDASPKAYAKCKALYEGRTGISVYNWAVSNKFKNNGKAILQESGALLNASDTGLVSTFHQHEQDRFKRTVQYTPVEVRTFKWKTALNRLQIKTYDFITIDIESDELNVLPDMDLSLCKMICLEWNGKPELKEAYEKYLEGFNLIYTSGENLLYARS